MEPGKNMSELFREAFRNFERKPSDKVWDNIEKGVKPPDVIKMNFFKPTNLIIGTAAIIVISVILYFIIPEKLSLINQPQTISNQPVELPHPELVVNKNKSELPVSPTSVNHSKTAGIIPANDVKINNTQYNSSKKQTIHDLIAQVNNKQKLSDNSYKTNPTNSASVINTNNNAVIQKTIDSQPALKSNQPVSKSVVVSEIKFSPDQKICKGDKVKLSVYGGASYLWSTGEKTQDIIVNPNTSIDYSVIATDDNGNRKTGLISVTVSDCNTLYVPNAFTPDGNGQSDVFKVYGNDISKFEIVIISRAGQVVYTSKNISEGWDGTIKGSQAQPGVYIYTIKYSNELNNEQILTGHITLIK